MVTRKHRAITTLAVFAVVVVTGGIVFLAGGRGDRGTTGLPSASGPPSPFAARGLKPEITGLLDRHHVPTTAAQLKIVDGFVTPVRWADLQAAPNGEITADNAIDKNLVTLRGLNARGSHLAMKIRVLAGIGAPDWAKQIGGAPISIRDPHSGLEGTVGRYWLPAFGAAWAQFMQALANKYDGVPEIRGVTISRCMLVYAEPLIRYATTPAIVNALLSAGYTNAADEACQLQQVDEVTVFRHTHLSLALNPYQPINAGGHPTPDERFTERLMDYCRSVLGERCILENDSIRTPPLTSYLPMYAAMAARGRPIAFQTAEPARIGSLAATLDWAVSQRAASVELPDGYQYRMDPASARAITSAMAAAQH